MDVEYVLRPTSYHSAPAEDGDVGISTAANRLVGFDLRVERRGRRLGGNNSQATVRAPDAVVGIREQAYVVALTLQSGWVVMLRNKFAEQPQVAAAILLRVSDELDALVARASEAVASGDFDRVRTELFEVQLRSAGPDYWR